MKQPGILLTLIIFIAGVSFVLAAQQEKGRRLTATLNGTAIVPGPGDVDGKGTLRISLNPSQAQICYELSTTNVGDGYSAELHFGATDQTGPLVIALTSPGQAAKKDCQKLDHDKVMEIVKNPDNYYLTIKNSEYPDGAIRGQLSQ